MVVSAEGKAEVVPGAAGELATLPWTVSIVTATYCRAYLNTWMRITTGLSVRVRFRKVMCVAKGISDFHYFLFLAVAPMLVQPT